jgi:hypothetical protein
MFTNKQHPDISQRRKFFLHQDLCNSCPTLSGHVPGQFATQKLRRFVVRQLHKKSCGCEFSPFRFFRPAPWPDKTAKGAYRISGASPISSALPVEGAT